MADTMKCVVVTPELTALEQDCDFVALPLYDGEIGIAPNHSPMIGRLGYGEMRIRSGGTTTRYYVDGDRNMNNNTFIIASRAYFHQSPTCTRVNNVV